MNERNVQKVEKTGKNRGCDGISNIAQQGCYIISHLMSISATNEKLTFQGCISYFVTTHIGRDMTSKAGKITQADT